MLPTGVPASSSGNDRLSQGRGIGSVLSATIWPRRFTTRRRSASPFRGRRSRYSVIRVTSNSQSSGLAPMICVIDRELISASASRLPAIRW
jgi:hypothetical protein